MPETPDWLPMPEASEATSQKLFRAFPCTDSGNGERIATQFQGEIRYCFPQKTWYVFSGSRWEPDQTGKMFQRAKQIARRFYEEASRSEDDDVRKKLAGWARTSESAERLKAALACAQSEPGVAVLPQQFDSDRYLFNCRNGTVNLHTGELQPHRKEDLITKLAPVNYDISARSALWDRFLAESTGNNSDLIEFLQRAAGYSLSGDVGEEKLFFVHGPGASGKSTFLDSLRATMGDYAKMADFESFIQRRDGAIRDDIAELAGRRFVVSIEVDEGKRLAEGLVKMVTGGDTVRARHLYQDAFEFLPQFKLWLAANHAPRIKDDDSAMWRRILRIQFEHVVPKEQRDPTLKARLRNPDENGPAILTWAVEGFLRFQESGLGVPEVVEMATEQFRQDMDPLRMFIEDRCLMGQELWVSGGALRSAYDAWGKQNGERFTLNSRSLADRLRARGCTDANRKVNGSSTRGWSGIGLREEDPAS